MTDDELQRWVRNRPGWRWCFDEPDDGELVYALDVDAGVMMCVTEPTYAECQGPRDPVCGRARFSVHGCNGSPSRAEFIDWYDRCGPVAQQARRLRRG